MRVVCVIQKINEFPNLEDINDNNINYGRSLANRGTREIPFRERRVRMKRIESLNNNLLIVVAIQLELRAHVLYKSYQSINDIILLSYYFK